MVLTLWISEVLAATPRARIVRLDLDGERFEYAAGQAVIVGGRGSDDRRPYSIAAAPEDARRDGCLELLVAVDVEGHAPSHLPLETGQQVDVDGPFGNFVFPSNRRERRFVFIAGGTGIAPLRAMLRHALAVPESHAGLGLFYSARTPEEFAYEAEFRDLAKQRRIELRQTVTRAGHTDWSGARGRIDRAALSELIHDPSTLCFVCGPPALVADIPKLLEGLGVSPAGIRIEEWR